MMSSNQVLTGNELRGEGQPLASYIKTILGQVAVTVWDTDLDKPVDIILNGNPRNKDEGCIVKIWSAKEDSVFKRMNQKHFKAGRIISYTVPEDVVEEKPIEQSTDDELKEIIGLKYLALVAKLNKIESIAVLFRMKQLAEDMSKSKKITDTIEARISELQAVEYAPKMKNEPLDDEE